MKHFKMSKLALAVAVSAFVVGCGKKEEAKPADAAAPQVDEVILTIGHVGPLTGPIAHLGKDNENGARLAVDDVNASNLQINGKKVKLVLSGEDDAADPKVATVVAQKLVDSKVIGVVGHLNSGTTIPASKIYNDAGIAQISPSATNPAYTQQGYKTAYRVMANDIQQGTVLGKFAAEQLKAKKVAIIDDRTAYGQGLADEVEKALKAQGVEVVAREFTKGDATDFSPILTKIKAKKPDVIFYGGMDAQAGPMAKQIKQLGIKASLLSGDGGCTPEFIKLAGDAANIMTCTQAGIPLDRMPKGKDFAERFQKAYGTNVQIYAPYSYDAVIALVEAMKKSNSTDPAKIVEVLPTVAFDGVTGKVAFDSKGDTKYGAVSLYQLGKDGKFEVVAVDTGSAN